MDDGLPSSSLPISARPKRCGGRAPRSYNRCLLVRARKHPLLTHICYFISISLLGYLALKSLPLKDPRGGPGPCSLDLFFTSVSAATVSSMSTVDMEAFSDPQLLVLTALMLLGGDVLTSAAALLFDNLGQPSTGGRMVELPNGTDHRLESQSASPADLRHDAGRCLVVVVVGYLLSVHIIGSASIMMYISLVSSARDILRRKHLKVLTFSIFTTVSSFSNCGFIPTNENMVVFSKNTGLLLLIIPLILLGNTMFPPALRSSLWVLKRLTRRREYGYLLERPTTRDTGIFNHLLPRLHSLLLVFTVLGLTVIQLMVVCSMEWRSEAFGGLSSYQKAVGALFLSVNSRHAGESGVNLSSLSPAVMVLFVVMMYLPPYTACMPVEEEEEGGSTSSVVTTDQGKNTRGQAKRSVVMSQLSCLAIFVILVCVTEKGKLSTDPLNFNVLNIAVEVVSAYGNVGFSTGYSCDRRLRADGDCRDEWYGFVGKWSSQGKLLLIFVMFFGRHKKFSMHCGQAWKLS